MLIGEGRSYRRPPPGIWRKYPVFSMFLTAAFVSHAKFLFRTRCVVLGIVPRSARVVPAGFLTLTDSFSDGKA